MLVIGDVRAGSVKRVGGAIGEGAAVVPQIHHYLGTAQRAGLFRPISSAVLIQLDPGGFCAG